MDAWAAAEARLLTATAGELPGAVAELVGAVWDDAASREDRAWHAAGMDGPTPGHAVFHLARGATEATRPRLMQAAYALARAGAAPDGRVLSAIAHAMAANERAPVVRDAAAAFRAAEQSGAAGASMLLVGLVDVASDDEHDGLLEEAVAAAARASNPELLGDVARGVELFEPLSVRQLGPAAMERLWERVGWWPEPGRQRVRLRMAAGLPSSKRAAAIAEVLAGLGAMWSAAEGSRAAAQADMVVLAPVLSVAQLEEAFAWFGAMPALIERAAVLGDGERVVSWLEQLDDAAARARTAVVAHAALADERLVDTVLGYLRATTPERVAWFFEDHGANLGATVQLARLAPILAALPLKERVMAMGALVPQLPPEERVEMLAELVREAWRLEPPLVHGLVGCASWLASGDARAALMELVDGHPSRKDLLMGADGEAATHPGLAQLTPLIAALGFDASLEAVVSVIVSRTMGDG